MCIEVQDSLVCRDTSGDGVAWWDVGGGMVWQFDLGAWANATTAIATIVALYFARKAWMSSQDNARAAIKMLMLEQDREAASVARAERAEQADLVAVWVEKGEPTSDFYEDDGGTHFFDIPRYYVHVRNASPLPVHQMKVYFLDDAGQSRGTMPIRAVPPGDTLKEIQSIDLRMAEHWAEEYGQQVSREETPFDLTLAITFTDTAQRRWKRAGDGSLERLAEVVS